MGGMQKRWMMSALFRLRLMMQEDWCLCFQPLKRLIILFTEPVDKSIHYASTTLPTAPQRNRAFSTAPSPQTEHRYRATALPSTLLPRSTASCQIMALHQHQCTCKECTHINICTSERLLKNSTLRSDKTPRAATFLHCKTWLLKNTEKCI